MENAVTLFLLHFEIQYKSWNLQIQNFIIAIQYWQHFKYFRQEDTCLYIFHLPSRHCIQKS